MTGGNSLPLEILEEIEKSQEEWAKKHAQALNKSKEMKP